MLNRLTIIIASIVGVNTMFASTIDYYTHIHKPTKTTYIREKIDEQIIMPTDMACAQWAQTAINAGWSTENLDKLGFVMNRESRCITNSFNPDDPNGGSYGLTQINAYWCKPSKWYPNGYLQSFGVIRTCEQLLHPRANLASARLVWVYADGHGGNGWSPWNP